MRSDAETPQVDNTKLNVPLLVRLLIAVTGVFVLAFVFLLALGFWPPTPSFPASEYRETETWERIRVEQRDELNNAAIPIDEAKDMIVEMGLPVRQGDGTISVEDMQLDPNAMGSEAESDGMTDMPDMDEAPVDTATDEAVEAEE